MADLTIQHQQESTEVAVQENRTEPEGPYYVKLQGIPYDASKSDIYQFLSDCMCKNGEDGIHMLVAPDSRPNGEALIELESHKDQVTALNHDRDHMGHRYVEVMFISREQFDDEMTRQPGANGSSDFVVRLRGLPYSAQVKDILSLLHDCQVNNGEKGVNFTFAPDGRPSGEAFVELCSEEDVSKAIGHNKEHMGKRYVEIFRASRGQMEWDIRAEDKYGGGAGTGVVRLRGLPFRCTEEQVKRFFAGLKIVPGGIVLQVDSSGKATGEAFVEFTTKEDSEMALEKDRQEIDHRYIEVFRSTHAEIRPVKTSRPTPYSRPSSRGGGYGGYGGYGMKYGSGYDRGYRGRGGGGRGPPHGHYPPFDPYAEGGYYEEPEFYHGPGGGYPPPGGLPPPGGPPGPPDASLVSYPPIRPSHPQPSRGGYGMGGGSGGPRSEHVIRMRGLPYSAKEKDIMDFFAPVVPLRVTVDYDHSGRPSGGAEVMFQSHEDANVSMQKNNQHIGHRYIELFLHSQEDPNAVGGGGPPPSQGTGARFPPPGGIPQQPQQQQSWTDPTTQVRPPLTEQAPPQLVPPGGAGYAQTAPLQQQQQPASGVGIGQYGSAAGGYQQQPPQQQQQASYQHSAGYGMAGTGGYGDQQTVGYQGHIQQPHDASYGQQQQQQQWGGY